MIYLQSIWSIDGGDASLFRFTYLIGSNNVRAATATRVKVAFQKVEDVALVRIGSRTRATLIRPPRAGASAAVRRIPGSAARFAAGRRPACRTRRWNGA